MVSVDVDMADLSNYDTLRDFVRHCVDVHPLPAKSIAMNMDLSPSALSHKLSPGIGETARFNADDLESYIKATGDTKPISYLVAKYCQSDAARKRNVLLQTEAMLAQVQRLLSQGEA